METIKSVESERPNLGCTVIEQIQEEQKELSARVARCELFMQTNEDSWWAEVQAQVAT